ncbi:MAG: NDP-hexose 4-ketoreductase, partial [Planctomycetota bacterium]
RENLVGIVEFELKKVFSRLDERNMALQVDQAAKDFLIEKGYNPDFGARPLRRAIEQYVEDPLSESILRDEFREGQVVKVTKLEDKEHLSFNAEDLPKEECGEDESTAEPEAAGAGNGGE